MNKVHQEVRTAVAGALHNHQDNEKKWKGCGKNTPLFELFCASGRATIGALLDQQFVSAVQGALGGSGAEVRAVVSAFVVKLLEVREREEAERQPLRQLVDWYVKVPWLLEL